MPMPIPRRRCRDFQMAVQQAGFVRVNTFTVVFQGFFPLFYFSLGTSILRNAS